MYKNLEKFLVESTEVVATEMTDSLTLNEVEGDPVIKWKWVWNTPNGGKMAARLGYSKASNDMLAKMLPTHQKTFFLDSTRGLGGSTHEFYKEELPSYEIVKERVIGVVKNSLKK